MGLWPGEGVIDMSSVLVRAQFGSHGNLEQPCVTATRRLTHSENNHKMYFCVIMTQFKKHAWNAIIIIILEIIF